MVETMIEPGWEVTGEWGLKEAEADAGSAESDMAVESVLRFFVKSSRTLCMCVDMPSRAEMRLLKNSVSETSGMITSRVWPLCEAAPGAVILMGIELFRKEAAM